METNSISKNYNKYKKIKYKRTGQTFQEVYNIIDDTNINFNNKNNQLEKKQLTKTPELSFLTTHFEGVLANC